MSYDDLMRELSQAVAERAADRRTVIHLHDTERTEAAKELRQARAEAARAQRRQLAADELFQRVQQETARQWQRLKVQLPSRRRARLGVLPRQTEPNRAQVHVDHPAEGASELIDEAREMLDELHGKPALSGGAYPLLVLLSVVCSGLVFLLSRGLLLAAHHAPGPVGTVLTTLGQITAFASPLGGLGATKLFANRAGARLDIGVAVTVLVAGLATLAGLGLLMGR
jgi:hypothetical protein